MAFCPECQRDETKTGKPIEVNRCAFCQKWCCFWCWGRHIDRNKCKGRKTA